MTCYVLSGSNHQVYHVAGDYEARFHHTCFVGIASGDARGGMGEGGDTLNDVSCQPLVEKPETMGSSQSIFGWI